MKLVVSKQNITLFGRIIQNLSKFRDELCFICNQHELFIKCVNSTKTCLASFKFSSSFFSQFSPTNDNNAGEQAIEHEVRFKLHSKSMLYVFKNLYHLEKCCDKIVISYGDRSLNGQHHFVTDDLLKIILYKNDGVETVFELNCLDDEVDLMPQIQYNTEEELTSILYNSFSATSKMFSEAINTFSIDDQICLIARPDRLCIQSYTAEWRNDSINDIMSRGNHPTVGKRIVKESCTELIISRHELLSYNVHQKSGDAEKSRHTGRNTSQAVTIQPVNLNSTSIVHDQTTSFDKSVTIDVNNTTINQSVPGVGANGVADSSSTEDAANATVLSEIVFNLKHLKIVLSLLQVLNLELSVNFAQAGQPLRVNVFETGLFHGVYWISTLSPIGNDPVRAERAILAKATSNSISMRDLPDDFGDDEVDDELMCSLAIEPEDTDEKNGKERYDENLNQLISPSNGKTSDEENVASSKSVAKRPHSSTLSVQDSRPQVVNQRDNVNEQSEAVTRLTEFVNLSSSRESSQIIDKKKIVRLDLEQEDGQNNQNNCSNQIPAIIAVEEQELGNLTSKGVASRLQQEPIVVDLSRSPSPQEVTHDSDSVYNTLFGGVPYSSPRSADNNDDSQSETHSENFEIEVLVADSDVE